MKINVVQEAMPKSYSATTKFQCNNGLLNIHLGIAGLQRQTCFAVPIAINIYVYKKKIVIS